MLAVIGHQTLEMQPFQVYLRHAHHELQAVLGVSGGGDDGIQGFIVHGRRLQLRLSWLVGLVQAHRQLVPVQQVACGQATASGFVSSFVTSLSSRSAHKFTVCMTTWRQPSGWRSSPLQNSYDMLLSRLCILPPLPTQWQFTKR